MRPLNALRCWGRRNGFGMLVDICFVAETSCCCLKGFHTDHTKECRARLSPLWQLSELRAPARLQFNQLGSAGAASFPTLFYKGVHVQVIPQNGARTTLCRHAIIQIRESTIPQHLQSAQLASLPKFKQSNSQRHGPHTGKMGSRCTRTS